MNWVRAGASTTVVVVDGIGHVRLVVSAVEVHTVPAHGEKDLVPDTVLTRINVREVDVLALSISGIAGNRTAVVFRDCYKYRFDWIILQTYRDKRS